MIARPAKPFIARLARCDDYFEKIFNKSLALYDQLSLHSDTFKGPVVGPMILYVDHANGQEDIASTCLSSMDSVFLLKITVTKHCDMNTIKSTERLNAGVFMIDDLQPLAKAPLIPVI